MADIISFQVMRAYDIKDVLTKDQHFAAARFRIV